MLEPSIQLIGNHIEEFTWNPNKYLYCLHIMSHAFPAETVIEKIEYFDQNAKKRGSLFELANSKYQQNSRQDESELMNFYKLILKNSTLKQWKKLLTIPECANPQEVQQGMMTELADMIYVAYELYCLLTGERLGQQALSNKLIQYLNSPMMRPLLEYVTRELPNEKATSASLLTGLTGMQLNLDSYKTSGIQDKKRTLCVILLVENYLRKTLEPKSQPNLDKLETIRKASASQVASMFEEYDSEWDHLAHPEKFVKNPQFKPALMKAFTTLK